jgi:hypothetical protein
LNLSPVLVGEEVSLADEKSCRTYSLRESSDFGFKEIVLLSLCNDNRWSGVPMSGMQGAQLIR